MTISRAGKRGRIYFLSAIASDGHLQSRPCGRAGACKPKRHTTASTRVSDPGEGDQEEGRAELWR